MRLTASVGTGKPNQASDVKLIQQLLNAALKPMLPLKDDGRFGLKTLAAIKQFQARPGVTPRADGIVDPNGQTFLKLIALAGSAKMSTNPAGKTIPPHVKAFIEKLLPMARLTKKNWGVSIGALIAQAAQETGWGKHVRANAYFGIKGKSPTGQSTTFTTHEVENGKVKKIDDSFRAYKDLDEAADDYGRFLKSNPRYAGCFSYSHDAEKFVAVLAKAGYATDPQYATKLTQIIRSYGLAQYDK